MSFVDQNTSPRPREQLFNSNGTLFLFHFYTAGNVESHHQREEFVWIQFPYMLNSFLCSYIYIQLDCVTNVCHTLTDLRIVRTSKATTPQLGSYINIHFRRCTRRIKIIPKSNERRLVFRT